MKPRDSNVLQCTFASAGVSRSQPAASFGADARMEDEALFSTLDALLEGSQLVDFGFRYLYVNDVVARQGRKRKEELLARTMMEVYPGVERTEMFGTLRRCMTQRTTARLESEFTNPDGSVGWFDLRIQPHPRGLFIFSIDITERKRAEQALLESDQRFRQLAETIQEVFWLADVDGNVVYVSPAYEQTWGRSRESLVHGIVARGGGHIEVTTELGVETTFHVYLPAYDPPSVRPRKLANGEYLSVAG